MSKRAKKKQKWRVRWPYVAFASTVLTLFAIWCLESNPLPGGAKRMAHVMGTGDGEELMNVAFSDEKGCSDLTPQKVHHVWQLLLEPLIRNSKVVEEGPGHLENNKTQATAEIRYRNNKGKDWTLVAIANQTDEGPKEQVIYSMLALASSFDENGQPLNTLTGELALKGIRRYRQRLEALGIHKLMLAPGTCFTWDQLMAKLTPEPNKQ